jgi:hypothetical protein
MVRETAAMHVAKLIANRCAPLRQRAEAAEARVKELEDLCDLEDKRMEATDWFRQYRDACIKISEMHDQLEAATAHNAKLRAALERIANQKSSRWNHLLCGVRKIAKAALAETNRAPS